MKVTLRIPADGGYKDIEVDITEEELAKLAEPQKTSKPTGYERVKEDDVYYYVKSYGETQWVREACDEIDDKYYDVANYYSSELVAENNDRADKLMRQLRRFAVEHREREIDWNDSDISKYCIRYDYDVSAWYVDTYNSMRFFAGIYFDSYNTAQAAINAFHDELMWYFTKYKDSL